MGIGGLGSVIYNVRPDKGRQQLWLVRLTNPPVPGVALKDHQHCNQLKIYNAPITLLHITSQFDVT